MKTEKTFTALFILALTLRLLDLDVFSLALMLILPLISIIYFPFAFYFFSDKTVNQQNVPLSIVGGISLAILPIGILFKIMFWPGAQFLLMLGIILTSILLIVCFFLNKKSAIDLKQYYKNYLMRIVFWLVLSICLYSISVPTLIKIENHDEPELMRLRIQAHENPDNVEYQNELEFYYMNRDSLYMDAQTQEMLKKNGYNK